jgi:glycosyltransferase involved in cell wall biosynthesis
MDNADISSHRRTHFATVVASRYEIAPYSVLEAMALGCPVVATAVGGIPELIKDAHNGLLVPPDANAIAEACRKLLYDHALAARLGRQACQDCRDLYGPESIARQTIAAYQEAIEVFRLRSRPRTFYCSTSQ